MGALLLFFDGVGLGCPDPAINPFAEIGARYLGPLAGAEPADGWLARGIDATLGVPGLPQSATGQTTLLTGVNAARVAGRHLTGTPGPSLRPLLAEHSLFRKLVAAGSTATSANLYTRAHLDSHRPRWSATTLAAMAAGIALRVLEDGAERSALFHDYTGAVLRDRGYDVRQRTAAQAAETLAALVEKHDFVFYEYFLTDLVGHRGTQDERIEQARRTEALVAEVAERLDSRRHLLVVTSDHGNLEDGRTSTHTMNPVPLLATGPGAETLVCSAASLVDVTPAIVEHVSAGVVER